MATDGFRFQIDRHNNLEYWPRTGSESFDRLREVPYDGSWTHVALVQKGPEITFYLNGEPSGVQHNFASEVYCNVLNIGRDGLSNLGAIDPFNGAIAEVRFWDHARTQEQIQSFMKVRLEGDEEGLIGYWPFDEGSGQVVGKLQGGGALGVLGDSEEEEPNDPIWISAYEKAQFIRGDVDGDGVFSIADAINILLYLFVTGPETLDCLDAADVDDNGAVNIGDAIGLLNFLFGNGLPPAPPWRSPGTDPTEDDALDCRRGAICPFGS